MKNTNTRMVVSFGLTMWSLILNKLVLKEKLLSFTETIIIALVMLFVMLPIRLLFVTYITPDWFGSLGAISSVIAAITILSYKKKLGLFGRMYWRQISKLHKGKRRILSYTSVTLGILFWSSIVVGIHYSEDNDQVEQLRQEMIVNVTPEEQAKIDAFEKAIDAGDVQLTSQIMESQYKDIPPQDFLIGIVAMLLLPIFNMPLFSLITTTMNDFTNGWFLHFATVFLVEGLELVGVMIFTGVVTHRKQEKV